MTPAETPSLESQARQISKEVDSARIRLRQLLKAPPKNASPARLEDLTEAQTLLRMAASLLGESEILIGWAAELLKPRSRRP
jgi:hypothetical protein